MLKPITLLFVALSLSTISMAQDALAQAASNGTALEAQAAALNAVNKLAEASDAYMKAGDAYTVEGNNVAAATDYGKAADLFEKQAATGDAHAQPKTVSVAKTAPLAQMVRTAAPIAVARPTRPLKLKPLNAKHSFIIGRAVYEDGRPIANFSVYAAGVAGSGRAEGRNGYYQIAMHPGLLISEVSATTIISYRGKRWGMTLHPVDGLGNGHEAKRFRGNTTPGIVRDFVLKMQGTAPAFPAGEDADYSLNDQGHSYRYGGRLYVGCTYGKNGMIDTSTGLLAVFPKSSKIILTLVPTAPRLDGSAGTLVKREFPIAQVVNVYGIPIGVYTATAQLREPNGKMHSLRMCSQMPTQPTDWKSSLAVEWQPFDPSFGGVNPTSLYFVE